MDLVGRLRARRGWRIGAVALALALVGLSVAGVRRARTREIAHAREGGAEVVSDPGSSRPVDEWTDRFTALQAAGDWAGLDAELDGIASREPDLYRFYRLGYLHARTKLAL